MPEGRFGVGRPTANSTLLLVIRETPVPDKENKGVFPEKIIRNSSTEDEIIEDIAERIGYSTDDVSIDMKSSVTRGFGQTDTYNIRLDVSGEMPSEVSNAVETLVSAGYNFNRVEFE